MLRINEIFGPTIQGEGAAAGRHCVFIRTALCNLTCTWCDTPYTWAFTPDKADYTHSGQIYNREENVRRMTTEEVLLALEARWPIRENPTIVVVSGGEPMLQQKDLIPVVRDLCDFENLVHIETAGTIIPKSEFDEHITQYNISPKLENSGNKLDLRYKPKVISHFADDPRAWFKYVCISPFDLAEVDRQVQAHGISPGRVMVMPEGTTVAHNRMIAQRIATQAIERGYGVSFRSHVLLWGGERGR